MGVSIGIERIFNILEEKYKDSSDIRSVATEVFVAVVGKNLTKERLKVLNELWDNGIKAEILYNENPRMDKQMDYAVNNKIKSNYEINKSYFIGILLNKKIIL